MAKMCPPVFGQDPWAGGRDPWSIARPPPGLPAPTAQPGPGTQAKLNQLKEELSQDMKGLVQQHLDASSQSDSHKAEAAEARLCKLETGFQELKAQSTKFEGWFQTFGQKMTESHNRVETLHQSFQAQANDVAQLRVEVGRQAEQLPATVQSAVSALSAELWATNAATVPAAINQLEALLSKKQRSE